MIISIEGNIGSGKSTSISHLKSLNLSNVVFLPEPVDVWTEIKDKDGMNIIEHYYSNQQKYAFSFQMMAYITRLSQLRKAIKETPKDYIIITERCLLTDRHIFAKMLYDDGKIEEIEYNIYMRWFDEFLEECKIDGIIYIETDPTVCKERIGIRNRAGENIPLSYLENCHKYHQEWLSDKSNTLTLDGNKTINFKEITQYIESMMV